MSVGPNIHTFTLIVVPEHDEEVRYYRFGRRLFTKATLLGCAVALCALSAGVHYGLMAAVAGENDGLRDENRALSLELQSVRERIDHLGGTLDRVVRFDQKLRSSTLSPQGSLAVGPTEDSSFSPPGAEGERPPLLLQTSNALSLETSRLELEAARREHSLLQLEAYFRDQASLLAATPSLWPMRGWVTSDFGTRTDPFSAESATHSGIDIAGPNGKEVVAPSDGTVVFAGPEGSYGNVLVIDHGHGLKTRYGHLSTIAVTLGTQVKRGQLLAGIGTTGRSTGPHLHYEVRVDGVAKNPRRFILDD